MNEFVERGTANVNRLPVGNISIHAFERVAARWHINSPADARTFIENKLRSASTRMLPKKEPDNIYAFVIGNMKIIAEKVDREDGPELSVITVVRYGNLGTKRTKGFITHR